jgi:hypothetical protein
MAPVSLLTPRFDGSQVQAASVDQQRKAPIRGVAYAKCGSFNFRDACSAAKPPRAERNLSRQPKEKEVPAAQAHALVIRIDRIPACGSQGIGRRYSDLQERRLIFA